MWAVIRYRLTPSGKVDHRTLRTLAAFAERYYADRFAVEMEGNLGVLWRVALVRSRREYGARLPKFYGEVTESGRIKWLEWPVADAY